MLNVPDKPSVEESVPASSVSQPSTPSVKITYQRPAPRKRSQAIEWFSFGCIMALVALLSYGVGAMMTLNRGDSSSSSSSSSSSTMSMSDSSSDSFNTANVPLATEKYGDQPAAYKVDADGAKHFTLTAEQVMWEVTAGHRVLAWTINGTVPGPKITVNAGDHVRITFINHFPTATAVHWHGLEVSTKEDGVPGLGQKPIQPGQTYNFDFTLHDQDVGTHWYHSHYDDMEQETNGFYGAFIVNPRPGSPQVI
ncbi:multicopper oxidase domain-containing protein, partial [Dictyobacter formicarum]|uniref:multicopper oxidase domain-containing protein n=1 Tax=Dictyobacter formicarum TaxID=2778368 RepID=UPI001914EB66